MEKEVKGLRKRNEQMETVVGAWKGEWGREMGRLGVVKKKKGTDGERGGVQDEDGEGEFGEFDLGGIERELGMLEDWVRIVEEEGEGEDDAEAAVVNTKDVKGNARHNTKDEEQGEREVESIGPSGKQ